MPPTVVITRDADRLNSIKVNGVEQCYPLDIFTTGDLLLPDGTKKHIDCRNDAPPVVKSPITQPVVQTINFNAGITFTATFTVLPSGLRMTVTKKNTGTATLVDFIDDLQAFKPPVPFQGYGGVWGVHLDERSFPALWIIMPSGPSLLACEDPVPTVKVELFAIGTVPPTPRIRMTPAAGWLGLRPGEVLTYTILFTFDADSPEAKAVYARIRNLYPPVARPTTDRSPIVINYVAGSAATITPANPYGYLSATNPFDYVSPGWEARALALADRIANSCIATAAACGSKRYLVWDIEGVGRPTQKYYGHPRETPVQMLPMADRLFSLLSAAGLKGGGTLRPFRPGMHLHNGQELSPWAIDGRNWELSDPDNMLIEEAQWAHARWGWVDFYVDTCYLVSPKQWANVIAKCPWGRFFTEHTPTNQQRAYVDSYRQTAGGINGSTELEGRIYPTAATLIFVTGAETPAQLAALTAGVKQGNAIIGLNGWGGPTAMVKKIYEDAAH